MSEWAHAAGQHAFRSIDCEGALEDAAQQKKMVYPVTVSRRRSDALASATVVRQERPIFRFS